MSQSSFITADPLLKIIYSEDNCVGIYYKTKLHNTDGPALYRIDPSRARYSVCLYFLFGYSITKCKFEKYRSNLPLFLWTSRRYPEKMLGLALDAFE